MKPTDKAILGMVSKSPGRNASEPTGGLENRLFRVSSGWHRPRAGKQATALEDRRSMECRLGRTRADGGKVARSSYPLSLV